MEFANVDQNEVYSNETNNTFESYSASDSNDRPNSELSFNNNSINIYVYQPYIRIRSIKLKSCFLVSALNTIYPANSTYIFNGQILDINKSFCYYNIQNENKMVLISSNMMKSSPNCIQKWISITSRKDYFEERINLNIKNDFRKEIARVKDIKIFKMENRKKHFGQFAISQFKKYSKLSFLANEKNDNLENAKINFDYNPLDCPSNDPLPIIW